MNTYHYDSAHRFPRDPRLIMLTAAIMVITIMMPLLSHGQTITSTQMMAYKHTGTATLSGNDLSPRVTTNATGQLTMNVHPNEDRIEYTLTVRNAEAVTAAHLHCATSNNTGPMIAELYNTTSSQNVNGVIAAGTMSANDLKAEAAACNPNITSIPHLVQAIRDGNIYAVVNSTNNPNGLLRGQVRFTGFTPGMPMMNHMQTSTVLHSNDLTVTELHNGASNSRTFMITISNRLIDQLIAAANELSRRMGGDLENRVRDWLRDMNIQI